jgi:hypothetical protein
VSGLSRKRLRIAGTVESACEVASVVLVGFMIGDEEQEPCQAIRLSMLVTACVISSSIVNALVR